MAGLQSNLFQEHLDLLSELRQNYAKKEDAAAVLGVQRVAEDIAQVCRQRETRVKEAIAGLSARVMEVEAAAEYPEEEGAHAARLAALDGAAAAAQENVSRLGNELADLRAAREALAAKAGELRARSAHIEQLVSDAEPRTRFEMSLYAHVSNISWELYKRGRVAGTISHPEGGGAVTRFDYDAEVMPPFAMANELWALMGTD